MLSLDDRKISLSDISADIIVINFWLSSCEPCIAELPYLKALQEAYDTKKLRVVLLAVDSKKNVMRFIHETNTLPLVALDAYGTAEAYSVEKFPETFVLNKKRIIVDKYEGYQEWSSTRFTAYFKTLISY
jgi:thiol-disulfide isomerase/thioredoxin